VQADGTIISGGLDLVDTGLIVVGDGATVAGSMNVTGGVNVVHGGFAVFNGSAQVLADGVNVSGGLTIVTDGMLLDGRSLRYVRRTFLIAESMHTPCTCFFVQPYLRYTRESVTRFLLRNYTPF
jgi:hypothetical protein